MRRQVLLTAVLAAAALLTAPAGSAQQPGAARQPARPGVMVVSQNKCRLDAVARVDSLAAIAFYPALDEMVREGRLLGWGVLEHLWGDEWNFVVYYTAADVASFHSAFGEAVRRVAQRRPNFMADFASYCTEHKDSIYEVMRTATAGPPPPR